MIKFEKSVELKAKMANKMAFFVIIEMYFMVCLLE